MIAGIVPSLEVKSQSTVINISENNALLGHGLAPISTSLQSLMLQVWIFANMLPPWLSSIGAKVFYNTCPATEQLKQQVLAW